MMKKVITMIIIAATVGLVGTGAYQFRQGNQNVEEIDYEAFYSSHKYEQVIPDEQIIKGDELAVGHIENFVGKKLQVGKPWPTDSMLETSVVRTENDLMYLYKVEDYNKEDVEIFFMFNDDTDIIRADKSDTTFVDRKEENLADYSAAIKDTNYSNVGLTAFGWKYKTDSYAISTQVVTSVWALEQGEELHLIWCNYDCPIWTDYSG